MSFFAVLFASEIYLLLLCPYTFCICELKKLINVILFFSRFSPSTLMYVAYKFSFSTNNLLLETFFHLLTLKKKLEKLKEKKLRTYMLKLYYPKQKSYLKFTRQHLDNIFFLLFANWILCFAATSLFFNVAYKLWVLSWDRGLSFYKTFFFGGNLFDN